MENRSAVKPLQRSSAFGAAPTRSWVGVSALEFEGAAAESRSRIEAWMAELSIPAASVAVAFEGRIVWSEAFGFADLERGFPATPRTRFAVDGLSAIFAEALVARLGGPRGESRAEQAELARREIVEPLGLAHTELAFESSRVQEWSVGYELRGRPIAAPRIRSAKAEPDLLQRSTAEDLARFGAAHLSDVATRIVRQGALEVRFAAGGGWSILRDPTGRELRRACGADGSSFVVLHPSERINYTVLCNLGLEGEPFVRIAACLEPFLSIDADRAGAARRRMASFAIDEPFHDDEC